VRDCSPFPWRPKSFAFFAPEAGGVLADMGVHYLDYLDTVVGALEPVSYTDDSRGGNEASLSFELRSGEIPVSMRLSRLDPAGAFLRFGCERGEILVEKQNERDVFITPVRGSARRVVIERPFPDPTWPKDFRGSFCAMLRDFEHASKGKQTPMAADASDAERTATLIEWAYNTRDARVSDRDKPLRASRPDVLVTGATGFIGGHLIDRLVGQGVAIRAMARSPASCANIARYPVEIAPVNLLDKHGVEKSVAGIGRVFHLAYGRDGRDAAAVTIEGTKNVVEASISAGVESVVIVSTMYVFGFPNGTGPIDESFPYRAYGGEYGISKTKMERWCLERAKSSGKTRIVVLNPTCVFGPGGTAYTKLPVELARQGQFCWLDNGKGVCNFTYVENVVDAMLAAATIEEAHGERFIINDGTMSWRDFIAPLLAPLDAEVPSYSVDAFRALPRSGPPFRFKDLVSATIAGREFRSVAKRSRLIRKVITSIGGGHRFRRPNVAHTELRDILAKGGTAAKPFPPEWLLDLYNPASSVFSAQKAREVLRWSPGVPYETARDRTVRWLEDAGYYASRAP
jgi:nucleoside-diphosphate-sugar epimerase